MIADRNLPAGSMLYVDHYHALRRCGGELFEKFDPFNENNIARFDFSLIFGGDGSRACPAQSWIFEVMGSMMAAWLRCYEVQTVSAVGREVDRCDLPPWPCVPDSWKTIAPIRLRHPLPLTLSAVVVAIVLNEAGYHVTLIERQPSLGGHAQARKFGTHWHNPAFGVFLEDLYPNLWELLKKLDVTPLEVGSLSLVKRFACDGHTIPTMDSVLKPVTLSISSCVRILDPRPGVSIAGSVS